MKKYWFWYKKLIISFQNICKLSSIETEIVNKGLLPPLSSGFSYSNSQMFLLVQTCRSSSCRHTLLGFTQDLMGHKLISSHQLLESILTIFHHPDH